MEHRTKLNFRLRQLPQYARAACLAFIVALTVGYLTGLGFVLQTDSNTTVGMQENYNGNEDSPDVMVMKFKKSPREMLTIIHTHVLSLSLIFFASGVLLFFSQAPKKLKHFLLVEPFISILVTFGGIYLLWYGWSFMAYIVLFSGVLMTLSYFLGIAFVLIEIFRKE